MNYDNPELYEEMALKSHLKLKKELKEIEEEHRLSEQKYDEEFRLREQKYDEERRLREQKNEEERRLREQLEQEQIEDSIDPELCDEFNFNNNQKNFKAKIKQWGQIVVEDIKDDIGIQWAVFTLLVFVVFFIHECNRFKRSSEKLEQDIDKLIEQRKSRASLSDNTVTMWYSAQNNLKFR